jgi:hypothetical protein
VISDAKAEISRVYLTAQDMMAGEVTPVTLSTRS